MTPTIVAFDQRHHRGYVTWRYLPRGAVAHALLTAGDVAAICGATALDSDCWLGTGSQEEYERAATLPECRRCAQRLR